MTVTPIATPYLGQYVQYVDGIASNPLKATICSVNVDGTVNVIVVDRCVQQYLVRRLPYVPYGSRYGGPVRPGDSRCAYQGNGTVADSTPVPPAPRPPPPVPVPGPASDTLPIVREFSELLAVTVADTLPPLTHLPAGEVLLVVNGLSLSSLAAKPDFTVAGQDLTWSAAYTLQPGWSVVAHYTYQD